jgi:hypothetical protein
MTCDTVAQPFARIINDALLIAGRGAQTGSNAGFWADQAQRCLQLIIGQWSVEDLYNFYINELQFTTSGNKLEYIIGIGKDVDALPFNSISSVWYYYAGVNRPLLFETLQSFNYFTYQNFTALPQIYTYLNSFGQTSLKMLPRARNDLIVTIHGKQEIGTPSIFDSNIKIPVYAESALIYQVANELYSRGAGSPNGNFASTLQYHMSVLKKASKQDRQIEMKPALFGGSIGRGYYYWNGFSNGGGNNGL